MEGIKAKISVFWSFSAHFLPSHFFKLLKRFQKVLSEILHFLYDTQNSP